MMKLQILNGVFFVTLFATLNCNPGRPPLPDSQEARHLFIVAETNRTQNGFLSKADVRDIFEVFDKNGDGQVDQNEFIERWEYKKLGSQHQAIALFRNIDTDKDSFISEVPDMSRVFIYFDRNGDGRVSEAEFVVVWQSLSLT